MDKIFEAGYHMMETSHWWFLGRRNIVLDMVGRLAKPSDAILEIGCSAGFLMQELTDRGFKNLQGIDISEDAIAAAHEKGFAGRAQVMDAAALAFEDEQFDLITASDVLEHIEDDLAALHQWHRVLKPGGKAIIFVPAFMALWSSHDEVNHHFRRYTLKELKGKAEQAGFKVEKSGYWNTSLFAPAAVVRGLQRMGRGKSGQGKPKQGDLRLPPKPVNTLFKNMLLLENKLQRSIKMPFGLSCFVVVSK